MKAFTTPPAEVVASWPKPNYVDPVSQGDLLTVVGALFTSIAFLFVCVRIYSRQWLSRTLGLDDIFIAISLAFAIPTTCLAASQTKFGIGLHIWDFQEKWTVPLQKIIWASEWTYGISSSMVKLSILMFYRRIQKGAYTRTFLWATWIGIVYNTVLLFCFPLYLVVVCLPTEAYWQHYDPKWVATHKYKCGRQDVGLPLSGVLSVVGDFYSTVLPLLLVNGLQMPKRRKWSLYSLFGLGFIVVAFGIYRPILIYRAVDTFDVTWELYAMWVWTIVELQLAIIVASIPSLKSFFIKEQESSLRPYSQKPSTKPRRVMTGPFGQHLSMPSNTSNNRAMDDDSTDDVEMLTGHQHEEDLIEEPEKTYKTQFTTLPRLRYLSRFSLSFGEQFSSQQPVPHLPVRPARTRIGSGISLLDGILTETSFKVEHTTHSSEKIENNGQKAVFVPNHVNKTNTVIEAEANAGRRNRSGRPSLSIVSELGISISRPGTAGGEFSPSATSPRPPLASPRMSSDGRKSGVGARTSIQTNRTTRSSRKDSILSTASTLGSGSRTTVTEETHKRRQGRQVFW